MRKITFSAFFTLLGIALLALQSCRDDSYLAIPPSYSSNSFVEQFDTLTAAQGRGWVIKNRSEPIGPGIWSQGPANSAYSSQATNNGCIASDATAPNGVCHDINQFDGVISNWVMSPVTTLSNNDRIIFYTKTTDGTWGDRLQVRLNVMDTLTECGFGQDTGSFKILLLDINPQNASNDEANVYGIPDSIYRFDPYNSYPTDWTRFEAKVQGLAAPTKGRFAFRHYVPNGGDNGMGIEILLDSVAYVSGTH